MRKRLSFFAVFNLFDTVELNHADSQAMAQKILLHIKKQENEIEQLKRVVNRFEPL